MWWQTLLSTLRAPSNRTMHTARKCGAPCRLTVVALESRDVPSYAVTDLGVTPGFVGSYAAALNQAGDVAGYEGTGDGTFHAFVWHNGVMTDLGTLGGTNSFAYGLNDAGQVVGQSDTGATDQFGQAISHAFLWQNGLMTDLGGFGGSYSSANSINNLGQVVGGAYTVDGMENAFLWQNGTMTDLETLPGATTSVATGINNAGQVVGISDSAPFTWQAGTMTALDMGWANSAYAAAINDAGQVVGSTTVWYIVNFTSASLWQNGQLTDLGSLDGWDGYATGINNGGQVVGMSVDPFLWQNGVMTDIASQIPSGGNTVFVQAINDAGQIAGSSNGHAVVLNPVASLPTLAVNDLSVIEGNSGSVAANFTVNLSAASSAAVTVQFTTVDGTATAGSDYQATSGTLTFGPGETSKSVTVSVIGDRLAEANETFSVILGQPTNATIANDTGVGTIVDDEPRISISDVTKAEGKNRTTTLFTFTVTLSGAYDQAVTMSFQTLNGTATTSDKDYVAKTGTLTFNPGETTKTITIVVNGDNKREANETFYLDLYGLSSNGLFTKSRGVGMILNDD